MGHYVCVFAGVNKSGKQSTRKQVSLKRMLAEQELSVRLSHGSLLINTKSSVRSDKGNGNETKKRTLISDQMFQTLGNNSHTAKANGYYNSDLRHRHKSLISRFSKMCQKFGLFSFRNLTWPVDEVTVAQSGDFHSLQKQHSGRDVRFHNMRLCLRRKLSLLWVQTETLAWGRKPLI